MLSLRRTVALAGLLGLLAVPTAASAQLRRPQPRLPLLAAGLHQRTGPHPDPAARRRFEDACGVAVDSFGDIYLADYYHRVIDVYSPSREYLTQIADPDGPCHLAVDSSGRLYVNHWHRNVVRYTPSEFPPTESTSYGAETVIDFPQTACQHRSERRIRRTSPAAAGR